MNRDLSVIALDYSLCKKTHAYIHSCIPSKSYIISCFCSSAILRYLVTRYKLPDHWYPADTVKRARVDEYLGWHSSNLRVGAAELIFSKVCTTHLPVISVLQSNIFCISGYSV